MPTYKIKAPDGNTYAIEGPDGATDEQVREQVLKQHPTAGGAAAPAAPRRKLTTDTSVPDPTEGMSFVEKALVGGASRVKGMALGAAQTLLPKVVEEKLGLQAAIDEQKRLDTPVNESGGGMVGNALVDMATFALPGGVVAKAAGKMLPGGLKLAQAYPKLAGLTGAAATSAAQSAAVDPLASDESLGTKSAMAAGGGAAGHTVGKLLTRAISPLGNAASTARQQMVKLMEDNGIKLSGAQATGSPMLRQIEMGLKQNPLTKALMTADSPEQKQAVSRMFAKEVGAGGDAPLTADVVDAARRKTGGAFDTLKGKTAPLPQAAKEAYADDWLALVRKMSGKMEDMGEADPRVLKMLDNAHTRLTERPRMSGDAYNELRSNLSELAYNEKSGIVKDTAKALMKMEDNAALAAFGKDAADVAKARGTYGNWKRVTSPGVLNAEGDVSTSVLGNRVQQRDPGAWASGNLNEFGKKAKAAQEILKPMGPDSGTASNTLVAKALMNPLTLVGGGAGATYGAINDPAAGTKGALSMGAMAALTQTKAGRKYLANALMKDNPELAKFIERSGRTIGAQFAAD
jgi:hypothetical protein